MFKLYSALKGTRNNRSIWLWTYYGQQYDCTVQSQTRSPRLPVEPKGGCMKDKSTKADRINPNLDNIGDRLTNTISGYLRPRQLCDGWMGIECY